MTDATTNEATQAEEGAVVEYQGQVPALPSEVVDQIIEDGKDAVLWLKVTDGGFRYGDDTFIEEIVGVITKSTRYFVKWEDNKADKLFDVTEDQVPEDYEIRCDIQVLTPDLTTYGISLAPTSYIYGFSQYVRNLRERGIDVTQIATKLWTEQRRNRFGVYNVVRFAADETIKLFEREPQDLENDPIPF